MNIGIVLAGGMSKGAYEIGCIKAITDYFGRESVKCVSASSIGTLVAYAFVSDQTDRLVRELKELDVRQSGKFFPSMSGNPVLQLKIRDMVLDADESWPRMYATVWNFTEKKVDYIPFHTLSKEEAQNYLSASVAIPLFNKGVRLNDCTLFDGAFIDNIPVYPMTKEELDYIFCIYFDPQNYLFEEESFDEKIIKLNQFPTDNRWENFVFDPGRIDGMIRFGYEYARGRIERVFSTDRNYDIKSRIYAANVGMTVKHRLTGDVILTNINKMTVRMVKRSIV